MRNEGSMRRSLGLIGILAFAACGRGETVGLTGDGGLPGADGTVFVPADADLADILIQDTPSFPDDQGIVGFDGPIFDVGLSPDAGADPDGDIIDVGASPDGAAPVDTGIATPDTGIATPDTGIMTPDTGIMTPDTGIMTPDTGIASPDSGLPTPDAGAGCQTNMDCGGRTRICDVPTGQCVECGSNMDCFGNGVCDVMHGHTCQPACGGGMRCFGGQVCDPAINACVDCLADTDCNGAEVCSPRTHTCGQCNTNADCTSRVGAPFCNTTTSECQGCLSGSDCRAGQTCEPTLHTCVSTGTRSLCEPCNADDQCGGPADLCIGTVTGGGFQDRSCAIDCTNLTCPAGFDCISVRNNTARQCRPSYAMQQPSCLAISHLGQSCVFDAANQDPGCGFTNRQDAQCVLSAGGGGVCTIWCNNQNDCPSGFTCMQSGPGQTGLCL